jgi:Ca-activated chloride channel family protein
VTSTSNFKWIGLAGICLLALAVWGALGGGKPAFNEDETIKISIASSSTKKEWLEESIKLFNSASRSDGALQVNGKAVVVQVVQEEIEPGKFDHYRSGTMVSDVASGKIKPTIISPAEESWLDKLNLDWKSTHGTLAITEKPHALVRTPLVVAMWQSRATALGCWPVATPACTWKSFSDVAVSATGWGVAGHPEWGKLKFGYGYVGESNSGTLTAVMLCMIGAGKIAGLSHEDVGERTACGEMIAGVERAKVHSGKKSDWLLGWMQTGGPEYLDAVTTYEQEVIEFNKRHGDKLREPLVAAYPQDGTVVVEHPFAILGGADWVSKDQVSAAERFRQFLLSSERQAALGDVGLRPANPATKPRGIETKLGANPDAHLLPVVMPDALVMERITEVWHKNKKHAVLALVFDKSGSMQGEKMTTALAGAKAFVDAMDPDDYFIWIPFDSQVYTGVQGTKADIGEKLTSDIAGTVASGGTSLNDAVITAYQALESRRKTQGSSVRYGIILLSDGKDTSSRSGAAALQRLLAPAEGDPTAIQIHAIGIGDDADKAVLTKIATSAHGRYWDAKDPKRVLDAYRQIAVHY